MRRGVAHFWTIVLLAVLGVAMIAPIIAVVRDAFVEEPGKYSLYWFHNADGTGVLDDALYREGFYNSLAMGGWVTLFSLIIAIPLALIAERFNFAGKRIWLALLQVPMILPPFVGALGLKGLFAPNGGINLLLKSAGLMTSGHELDLLRYPFWTCVALITLYLYPITFLNVQAALANIDPALNEAAANLGAGPIRRFFRVTLPLMWPGVFAGSTIVFIWAFTELGTPLLVQYKKVTAVQIFDALNTTNPEGWAYALVVVLLVISVVMYALGKGLLGRSSSTMMAKATVASQPKRLGLGRGLLATLPFAVIFVLAVIPHIGVILGSVTKTGMIEIEPAKMTLEHHEHIARQLFARDEAGGASMAARSVANSFKYSILATVLDIGIGFGVAYLAVRRRSWLTAALDNLAMLPLAVPGLVMAFGYFAMTQGNSPFAFLNPLKHDPTALLVIAFSMRRLPFLVRSCAAGLQQTSEALEEASLNLGAGRLRTLWQITVPLLAANFIAGALLVFSRSMLEVSDSLILAFDARDYPMTKAMWTIADQPQAGFELASALGVWGMLILIITIGAASLALGKRLGALFRV